MIGQGIGRRSARYGGTMLRLLKIEWLEARQMLSSTTWQIGSGNWALASNWSNGVPTATTDAIINPTTAATITIQPGESDSVQNLTIDNNATLSMPGGSNTTVPTSNLLANSDFQSPVTTNSTTPPAGFSNWGSAYLSTQYAYTGSQSLVLSGSNSGVNQSVAATSGSSYTASAYAMMPAANPLTGNAGCYLQIIFENSSYVQVGTTDSFTMLTASSATGGPLAGSVGNQGWSHYYTTAVAPSGTAYAFAELEFYSTGSAGGAAYCDDLDFGPAAAGASALAAASITNNGTLIVGAANTVTDSGTLTQSSTGTLDIQLGGGPSTGSFGFVKASGAATLAGTLKSDIVD